MKRFPVIRHIRWAIISYRVHRWAQECARLGLGFGHPNDTDLHYLRLVWEGKA